MLHRYRLPVGTESSAKTNYILSWSQESWCENTEPILQHVPSCVIPSSYVFGQSAFLQKRDTEESAMTPLLNVSAATPLNLSVRKLCDYPLVQRPSHLCQAWATREEYISTCILLGEWGTPWLPQDQGLMSEFAIGVPGAQPQHDTRGHCIHLDRSKDFARTAWIIGHIIGVQEMRDPQLPEHVKGMTTRGMQKIYWCYGMYTSSSRKWRPEKELVCTPNALRYCCHPFPCSGTVVASAPFVWGCLRSPAIVWCAYTEIHAITL